MEEKILFDDFDINKSVKEIENLYRLKKIAEAAQKATEVLPLCRSIKNHNTDALGKILFYNGRAWADLKQYKEALVPLLEAESFYRSNFPKEMNIRVGIDVAMGDCYFNLKQFDKARSIYTTIEHGEMMGEISLLHLKVFYYLGSIYLELRDIQKGVDYYEKYLSAYKICYPDYQQYKQYDDVNRKTARLKSALKAKSLNYQGEEYRNGMISYPVEGSTGGIMDIAYAKYIVCELPDPSQKDLEDMFSKVTKIQLFSYVEGKQIEGKGIQMEKKMLNELSKDQIQNLCNCLKINKDNIGHVMDFGKILFKFFENENVLGIISYPGYGYIRWEDKWKDDAQLTDPEEFLKILYLLGISEPLNTWNEYKKNTTENGNKP
jgi:tetratricopeptide (TPR) repeat protein